MNCPLCKLNLKEEMIFYEDGYFLVLRTKKLKGHKERIMIISKIHIHELHDSKVSFALDILERVGRKVFKYAPKFVIMDSTFATIKQHWHLVATDLDPKAEDFEQILKTKWLAVVDT